MPCYSDFVLALKPWAYYRFQEPLNHNLYFDSSGNLNHCFHESLGEYTKIADNLQRQSFPGEPFSQSVTPVAGFSRIGLALVDTAVKANVPVIYLDHPNRFNGFDTKKIGEMWAEALIDCSGSSAFHAGPMKMVIENGSLSAVCYYKEGYFAPGLVYRYSFLPVDTYSVTPQFHRISLGVREIDSRNFTVYVAIDDQIVTATTLQVDSNDTFDLSDRIMYRNVGFCGTGRIGNMSVFINRKFPDQAWFSESFSALTSAFSPIVNQTISTQTNNTLASRMIDDVPGSTFALLDSSLIVGTDQCFLTESVPLTGKSILFISPQTVSHTFIVGDIVSISGAGALDGYHKVSKVSENSIEVSGVSVGGSFPSYSAIIKRSPLGANWQKLYLSDRIGYRSASSSLQGSLVIKDDQKKFSELRLGNQTGSGLSDPVYLKKNLKTTINTENDYIRWKIGGDHKRFFLFVSYKHNSPTLCNHIVFGDIRDFQTNQWECVLIGYRSSVVGNLGINHAMAYSDWLILDSGHLCCRATENQKSDLKMIKASGSYQLFNDSGYHLYPSLIPLIEDM